jgi:predicted transposase YdaD
MFEANADDRLRDYMFSLEMQMLDERTREVSARMREERIKRLEESAIKSKKEGIELGIEQGIEKGIEKGIEQGIGQGEEKRNRAIVLNMLGQGIDIATIAQLTGISLEDVKAIVASVTY